MEKVKVDTEIRKLDQLRSSHIKPAAQHPVEGERVCPSRSSAP